jgi:hypothetical protein
MFSRFCATTSDRSPWGATALNGWLVPAWFVLAMVLFVCPQRLVGGGQRPAVPVLIGGPEHLEGCPGTAIVVVRSHSWLNLRSGPGRANPVLAQLQEGQPVSVCQRRGDGWIGVIVHPDDRHAADCGLSDAGAKPKAYAGPCRSGWVSGRYLRIQAG